MSRKVHVSNQKVELTPKLPLTDEEKLILSAKASADAIYDWDMVAGLTTWNHGLHTLFGYDSDSVKAHHWWEEHIHPDDQARVIKSITAASDTRSDYWTDEYRFRCAMSERKQQEYRRPCVQKFGNRYFERNLLRLK